MKDNVIWFFYKASSFTLVFLYILAIFATILFFFSNDSLSFLFTLIGLLFLVPSIKLHTKRTEKIIRNSGKDDQRIFLPALFVFIAFMSTLMILSLFLCFTYFQKDWISYIGVIVSAMIMLTIIYIGKFIFSEVKNISNQGVINYNIILSCFGTLICVSNILALSVGIFDISNANLALYYDVPDKNNNAKIEITSKEIWANGKKTGIKSTELKHRVYFEEGSSIIKCIDYKEISSVEINKKNNDFVFARIREILDTLSGQKNMRFRISLIGHADDNPLGYNNTRYKSNYELSVARIQNVQYKLMNDFKSKDDSLIINSVKSLANTEWLLNPLSNEQKYEYFQPKAKSLEDKRVVEIIVTPMLNHSTESENFYKTGNQLKHLDYIYFMFYTITTTGYGDIKPVAPFIKFCTTLANLYELIFMVVFFNILLSLKSREQAEVVNQEKA